MSDEFNDEWDPDVDDDDEFHDAWYECPECGCEVYEDANMCPRCEQFIVPKLVSRSDRKPIWWVVLAVLGTIALVTALLGLP